MTDTTKEKTKILLFKSKNNIERKKIVKNILFLEKKCFPKEWLYDDAIEYYEEQIKYSKNINLLIKSDNKIVGYLLAKPLESSFEELKKEDNKLLKLKDTFYIDTVEILPKYQGKGFYKKILKKLILISKKRKIKKICLHARLLNNTSEKTKDVFIESRAKLIGCRKINRWFYGGNEPYEFICFKL
jgi:GNAT superfamily N-acetyltransferase